MRETITRARRLAAGASAALLATALVTAADPAAGADESFAFRRLAGADRYATAAAVAGERGAAAEAVLATGQEFPDALAGSFLAGARSAPILLTARDSLPASTSDALDRLGVEKVTLLGGPGAISTAVEQQLEAAGHQVTRLGGEDRYETAGDVAEAGGAAADVDGKRTAIVASGQSFADAVAAAPLAAGGGLPTLLTPRDRLSPYTASALESLEVERALVVGGIAAVSAAVAEEIADLGIEVVRLGGDDRLETATLIADYAVDALGFDGTEITLARGDDFADALAGGPSGGRRQAVTLLAASPTTLGQATTDWLETHGGRLTDGAILGGPGAISSQVEQAATEAVRAAAALDAIRVRITSGPANGAFVADSTPTYGGSASAAGGTVDDVKAAVDGAAPSSTGVTCTRCGTGEATWSYTPTSPLSEGPHTLVFRGSGEGADAGTTTATLTVDTVAPTFDEVTATKGTSTVQALFSEPLLCSTVTASDFTVAVNGAATSVSSAACSGDAASTAVLTIARTLSVGQEVVVTLQGDVTDRAGSVAARRSRTVVVPEVDPPTLAVTSGPAEGSHVSAKQPTWSGSATGHAARDVSRIEARVDSGAFSSVTCTGCPGSPVTWSFTPSSLSEGAHTVELRAVDAAGARSSVTSRSFTVDTVQPELETMVATAKSKDVSLEFDDTNGIDCTTATTSRFTVRISDDPVSVTAVDCTAPSDTVIGLSLASAPLGGDEVEVTVADTVTDRAGNAVTQASREASVELDNTAPTVAVTSGPADGATTNDPRPAFGGTAADEDGAVSSVEAKVGSGAFTPVDVECTDCGTPSATWSFRPAEALANGEHTIVFRSVDNAGGSDGTSSEASRTITVRSVTVAIDSSSPAEGAYLDTRTVTFTGTAGDGTVKQVEVSRDGGAATPVSCTGCPGGSVRWSYTTTLPSDGTYELTFQAVDTADRRGTPVKRTFHVDTVAPGFDDITVTALMPNVDAVFIDESDIDCEGGAVKDAFLVTFGSVTAPVVRATCNGTVVTLDLAMAPAPGQLVAVQLTAPVKDQAGNASATGTTRKRTA